MGRKTVKDFVKGMVVKERAALDGMLRALRRLRKPNEEVVDVKAGIGMTMEQQEDEDDEALRAVDRGEAEVLLVNGVGLESEEVVVNGIGGEVGEASGDVDV